MLATELAAWESQRSAAKSRRLVGRKIRKVKEAFNESKGDLLRAFFALGLQG